MKVFKFGGASIENAARMQHVADIVNDYANEKILLVVSALGKTTNALEKVVEAFFAKDLENARLQFEFLEVQHNALAQELMPPTEADRCILQLRDIYAEADWILNDTPVRSYDYYYDQLVCLGEMMSTIILVHYFNSRGLVSQWQDVRDILRTDNNWREGNIDWVYTTLQVQQQLKTLFDNSNIVITQGFIGCTDENESTTLGREGSDFSGAVFANLLDAESLTIWKDVKGLLSGDPKIFKQVEEIKKISYLEVIEMAYYGAQVIHPKTIKPLQNKHIPLHVKCFLDKSLEGTVICNDVDTTRYLPILVLKKNQILLQVFSRDFSFITDDKLSDIYETFHSLQTHINIIQNTAVSFLACIDNDATKVATLKNALGQNYRIELTENIQLLTIRHYNTNIIAQLLANAEIHLEQRTQKTVQYLLNEGSIHL